ncbi:MAG TPA: adenylate/guanylate cyclase domain-containing protein [Chloroflexia bacterium]|nr:adenylate/guanylate cyclase domain-containing protein [Chloroflexia bacterium]
MNFSDKLSSFKTGNFGPNSSHAGIGYGHDGTRQTPRILIVDDIAANVELLEALLTADGYDVSLAYDGEEALQKVDEDDPDLILLDVMMPGLNGFEVCSRLKQNERTQFIPVVLLTALDQVEDKVRGLDSGADDFLTKPFNRLELKARIRSLLRIRSLHNDVEQKRRLLFRLLNRYMSEEIVATILEDPEERLKLGGEKREVAILFADIRGFTTFSECTSAERVVEVLNECFHDITEVVFRHKGTFDKYVGDCILAFYGAPISYGDDLYRCLTTAVEMQRIFTEISRQWTDPHMRSLGLGIGINFGEVVVGNIGSERLMDYTIIGDNVNLAQRLEQAAQGGQILISEEVYRRVKEHVKASQLAPISVKGKREPVTAYLLEGLLDLRD